MERVVIRQYRKKDRDFVRDIAWSTAFMGEPASTFFEDRQILTDFLTIYFTDYEPESCFVAEVDNVVIGYLLGAKDVAVMERILRTKIWVRLFVKFLIKGTISRMKNIIFIFHCLLSYLRGEFKDPDFSKQYPACLHINIKQGFRDSGIGTKLIAACLDYLAQGKIKGVHLATMSDKAGFFFVKQGFDLLYKGNRSYFRYILHRGTLVYIYGKKLQ